MFTGHHFDQSISAALVRGSANMRNLVFDVLAYLGAPAEAR
jgi:hypothetical protein